MAYDLGTPEGQVRLLLNDVAIPYVFTDEEIKAFLALEGGSVKLAAATAVDTSATNMVLAMRVLRTQDVSTDGAKVAQAMRDHADRLRAQAEDADGGYFEILQAGGYSHPELTSWPIGYIAP